MPACGCACPEEGGRALGPMAGRGGSRSLERGRPLLPRERVTPGTTRLRTLWTVQLPRSHLGTEAGLPWSACPPCPGLPEAGQPGRRWGWEVAKEGERPWLWSPAQPRAEEA